MCTTQRLARALAVIILGALALSAAPSSAEPWPQRTVRFIVPLPPGTSTDLVARLFADRLSERWRQPVVVENRQGADGIPAVTGFVSARDNHSLLFSFAGIITINPLTYDKLPYDPVRDLVPVAWVADNFIGIAVPETLKVNSLDDFVKLTRSQPGKLNWAASPGVPHYVFAALQKSAGIEMMQVSYRDFRPALQDLGEGRIQAVATAAPTGRRIAGGTTTAFAGVEGLNLHHLYWAMGWLGEELPASEQDGRRPFAPRCLKGRDRGG